MKEERGGKEREIGSNLGRREGGRDGGRKEGMEGERKGGWTPQFLTPGCAPGIERDIQ